MGFPTCTDCGAKVARVIITDLVSGDVKSLCEGCERIVGDGDYPLSTETVCTWCGADEVSLAVRQLDGDQADMLCIVCTYQWLASVVLAMFGVTLQMPDGEAPAATTDDSLTGVVGTGELAAILTPVAPVDSAAVVSPGGKDDGDVIVLPDEDSPDDLAATGRGEDPDYPDEPEAAPVEVIAAAKRTRATK